MPNPKSAFLEKLKEQYAPSPSIAEGAASIQHRAMAALAQKLGAESGADTEESSWNIVNRAAKKIGIPEDSKAAFIAKALAAKSLEVLTDPTNLIAPTGTVKSIKPGVVQKMEKLISSATSAAVVKSGSLAKGELLKEASQLSKDAKVVQKISSGGGETGRRLAAEKLRSDARAQAGKFKPTLDIGKVDAGPFHKAVSGARNATPMHGLNITDFTAKDYAKMKTYMTKDGKSGYAIKPETDELVSVFSTEKGRGKDLVRDAIINKRAQNLDAFDINGKLPELYGELQSETKRLKFDPQYAPPQYDAAVHGSPDVVYMQTDPKKVVDFMKTQDKAPVTGTKTEQIWETKK